MSRYSSRLPVTFIGLTYAAGFIGLLAAGCAMSSSLERKEGEKPRQQIPAIAVLDFENHGFMENTPETLGLEHTLVNRIIDDLAVRADLKLIDRESLLAVIEELHVGSADLVSSDTRLKLGRLLGAQYFVMGGYAALGDHLRMDGRIVEVESGLTEGIAVEGTVVERASLEQALSRKLVAALTSRVHPAGVPRGTPKTSHDFYLAGISFEQEKDYPKALEMYQKALSINPEENAARERMEALLLKEIE